MLPTRKCQTNHCERLTSRQSHTKQALASCTVTLFVGIDLNRLKMVTFYHRQNGRGHCTNQSSLRCVDGACVGVDAVLIQETDRTSTGQDRSCQTEGYKSATVFANQTSLRLSVSGCCWTANAEGKTNWTTQAELDLGTRSDSHAINRCPVTTTVSSLRIPQNCFTRVRLLAHDPDGDKVRCRFADGASAPTNITLDEAVCTLQSTGQVQAGVHVFEVMVEDFSSKNITLTYRDGTSAVRTGSDANAAPLCSVKLQFVIEVLQAASCGRLPTFLSRTPSHGDILHAAVGKAFHLVAEAKATSQITDFQVSGPLNMNKSVTLGAQAQLSLNWTPQSSDLYRFVPVCFTADTLNNTQSEMRCVVVMVTSASTVQGNATVQCSPNKMVIILEKASMPGIDVNFLQLIDPSCSLSSNDTHIMGAMSFSTCGTELEDKGDNMVFKNRINSFVQPNEVIVRRRNIKIDFSCEFPKTISISSYYNLHNSDYIFTESSFGSFGYAFDIYRDNNFTNKVEPSAYPVQVMLMDTIYMGIQANSELPNVTLFVESCKATPDDNPNNGVSYDLIKNG
uniref:ZP domain-containing protein n=1 Tax=Oryzias latipes TaxID=8090 RepID=A0A3P9HME0_ORYLA